MMPRVIMENLVGLDLLLTCLTSNMDVTQSKNCGLV